MKILIVTPTGAEYFQIQDVLDSRRNAGIELHNEYEVLETGMGKVRVASALTKRLVEGSPVDLIVITGFAAGSAAFLQGMFVSPNKTCYHDVIISEDIGNDLLREFDLVGEDDVKILTGDSFIESELASELTYIYGERVIFDMESAAVCHTISSLGLEIPVKVMKLISDIPESDEHNEDTYSKFVDEHPDGSMFIDKLEDLYN